MVYLIQGDEFEIGPEMLQRLAEVMAESEELVLADATYRLRHGHGIWRFEERAEAERVAARFEQMGVANFLAEELLPVPREQVVGPGMEVPKEPMGLVVLGRVELEERRAPLETNRGLNVAYLGMGVALPKPKVEEAPSVERKTRYYLDFFVREKHWQVRAGVLNRVVDTYLALDVSEARVSEGVRSLSREDRPIPLFHSLKEYQKEVLWLYQLAFAG